MRDLGAKYAAPKRLETTRYSAPRGIAESAEALAAYLTSHGVTVKRIKDSTEGVKILVLDGCPMNSDHGRNGDTAIVWRPTGIGFECKHNGCQPHTWPDVRRKIDPNHTQPKQPTGEKAPAPARLTVRPFPVDSLPKPLASLVRAGAKSIGCDPSFVALPCLSVVASCIGNARRIRLKRSWTEPSVLWTATVAESGEKKTPPHALAMRPLHRLQSRALKQYDEAVARYNIEVLNHGRALQDWKRGKVQGEPPCEPKPPTPKQYFLSDTTVEAAALILRENPRGQLLSRDELSGWIGSFDRYAKGKSGDAAHWLEMWQAGLVKVNRKTDRQIIYVPRAAMSITGNIQPAILNRVLGSEHRENGLAARFLLAYPPPRACRWNPADIPVEVEDEYSRIVERLYELQMGTDVTGDETPVIVRMSPEAHESWVAFYNSHNAERAELTGDLKAAWAKLEAYVARLALVVHFVRWAADDPQLSDPDVVDRASIEAGICLVGWFKNEARRLYGRFGENEDESERRKTVELIHAKGGAVSIRDWQRIRHYETAEEAEIELNQLAASGLGQWEQTEPGPRGGRPKRVFRLVAELGVTKPMQTSEKPGDSSPSLSSRPEPCDDESDEEGVL